MKKLIFFISTSVLVVVFTSCSKTPIQKDVEKISEQKPIQIAAPVANSITDFSFYFFKNLQETQPVSNNLFVSPLSLHMALGMLVNGATATTKDEIMKALKAESISQADLNASYKKLLNELPAADPSVKLALANSVWNKADFVVEPAFMTTLKDYFNAEAKPLTTVDPINKWASDNTNGKIPKVLDSIDPDLVMILMNALYFKGDWTTKFEKKNTVDQAFNLNGGGTKTVQMMNMADTFMYASAADYQVLQMPYGNGQFRATLILPKPEKIINSVLNDFSITKWNEIQSSLITQRVIVGVPKFKLEQEFKLNATLQKMGMLKAFTDAAELQGIHKTAPLSVSFVKQNTFAAVDEEGTEAAAVTTIGIILTSMPSYPVFICNRPFAFIISEKTSNTILFMGRIMNPESN